MSVDSQDGVSFTLEAAIRKGKALGKKALYFGCWKGLGHFLYDVNGLTVYRDDDGSYPPWGDGLMDSTLLKNRRVPDVPDGRVYWTAGGHEFWYAFVWWDRSVDTRGNCNSGLYVRGFGYPEAQEAFGYACAQFPHVVGRQQYPLVLQLGSTKEETV